MRRFLTTSFIALALFTGATGFAPAAHAVEACTAPNVACVDPSGKAGTCNSSKNVMGAYECIATNTAPVGGTNLTGSNAKVDAAPSKDEGYNYIMAKIMSLFAWLVGVAAITLDYAVYYTVVSMGTFVHNLAAVGVTWRILRDLGNIMLIFGFLAVGITTILNVDWYGGGKKMLPMMFVAAVFLNFSLFITEAIIDTGNLFATQFYTQINGGSLPTRTPSGILTTASGESLTTKNEGISNRLMAVLEMQKLYGAALDPQKSDLFEAGNPWFIGFMGILLFIVTAFVMFSLAFVLIARFVALIFLLVVAPVGFAGLAVPGFAARAKQWWDTLFEQTITAPILLLMLYVALAVITDNNFLSGFAAQGDWTGFVGQANLPGFASMMLSFLVAMGLMLAVVIYAKRWSAFGGDWASRTASKLTFGLAAWGGTKAIGLPAHYAARAVRTNFGGTRTGRVIATALDKGAKGSFDVRSTGVLKTIPFGSNIDAGKAAEGGYRGQRERTIKAHEEYTKSIDEAYKERGEVQNEEEEQNIAQTTLVHVAAIEPRRVAQTEKSDAEKERDAAQARFDQRDAAVRALEEEKKKDRYWETNPENLKKMEEATRTREASQKDLVAATGKLETAVSKLTAADATLAAAEEAKTEAEKAPDKRMKEEKTAAKEKYAGKISTGITQNPFMWAANLGMYGPGGSQAAAKIRESLKEKTNKDKIFEAAVKAAHEEDEGKKKAEGAEKSKAEAPKPIENKTKPSDE